MYHQLVKKLYKMPGVNRSWNDVIHDDPIQCEDWKDGEVLSMNEVLPLHTSPFNQGPPFGLSQGSPIVHSFVYENQHITIRHFICNPIHKC